MSRNIKLILLITISLAVMSGFINVFVNEDSNLSIAALHVFLFNLAAGGTLIITRFSERKTLGISGIIFYIGSLVFTAGAFFGIPAICIASALALAVIVERIRWVRFSWFPVAFFQNIPVYLKFRQAALLCLSMSLVICAVTLTNNNYLHLVHFEKLDLHVFFLGFSFPISLSTFSYIFERIESDGSSSFRKMSEFCFWALNMGVIFFFLFIILEIYPGQLAMSMMLFTSVFIAIYLHLKETEKNEERTFLLSALLFLVLGSITGIAYIVVLWKSPSYTPGIILSLHSAATVFGWNMVWLMLTARKDEYPIKVNVMFIIVLQWLFVVLIPFARNSVIYAVPALILLIIFLYISLFSPTAQKSEVYSQQP